MSRKTIEKNCEYCNLSFKAPISEVKRGYGKFCSIVCSKENRKLNSLPTIDCKKCKKSFKPTRSNSLFCSKSCSVSFNNTIKTVTEETKIKLSNINIHKYLEIYNKNKKSCAKCGTLLSYKNRKRKYCPVCFCTVQKDSEMTIEQYRNRCKFIFSLKEFKDEFDFSLIEEFGWYSPSNKKNNLQGVSRDHMFSIKSGYILGLDPKIIAHPANCKLIRQNYNPSKKTDNSISLLNLLDRINNWNKKYKRV